MFGTAEEKCELFWFYYLSVLSCSVLDSSVVGLDIQDEMGRHEVGHIDNSMKIPLNQGDGCRFEGEFTINKVSRNTHISYCLMWPAIILRWVWLEATLFNCGSPPATEGRVATSAFCLN